MKEARARRDLVAGEIAAGRNPAETLRALENVQPLRTYRDWSIDYRESRIDLSDGTRRNLASHLALLNDIFGDRDPGHAHRARTDRGRREAREESQRVDIDALLGDAPAAPRLRRRQAESRT